MNHLHGALPDLSLCKGKQTKFAFNNRLREHKRLHSITCVHASMPKLSTHTNPFLDTLLELQAHISVSGFTKFYICPNTILYCVVSNWCD